MSFNALFCVTIFAKETQRAKSYVIKKSLRKSEVCKYSNSSANYLHISIQFSKYKTNFVKP